MREFEEIERAIYTLAASPDFNPYSSTSIVSKRDYHLKREHNAHEIARLICPNDALTAFKNFLPVDDFEPGNVNIPTKKNILLEILLYTLKDKRSGEIIEKNTLVKDAIGRLCIVGFNRVEMGKKILFSYSTVGVRTFYFALRDAKMPYKIGDCLKDYVKISFGESRFNSLKTLRLDQISTWDQLFMGDLYDLVKTDSSDARALKAKIDECGLTNLFEEYKIDLGRTLDQNIILLHEEKNELEEEKAEHSKELKEHEENSENSSIKLNLLKKQELLLEEEIVIRERLAKTLHERKLLFVQQKEVTKAKEAESEIETYKEQIEKIEKELITLQTEMVDLLHELGPFLSDGEVISSDGEYGSI